MPRGRDPLDVWLYDTLVGRLSEPGRNRLRLDFTEEAEIRFGLGSAVLSAALPIDTTKRPSGLAVRAFFAGLLPEGEARDQIEREFDVARSDDFGLLAAIGRDCAGAIVLLPTGQLPIEPAGTLELLGAGELETAIAGLADKPLGADGTVRVSLAGLQQKLLLATDGDDHWGRPVNGYPSTHILKPQDMRLAHYAVAEAFCLDLAGRLGLPASRVLVIDVGARPVLVVARYDRTVGHRGVERIHQEDAAQALSVDIRSGGSKYEADGGPSLRDFARLIAGVAGPEDVRQLLRLVTCNVIVGNADAHAKNVSLLHLRDGSSRLAPAYDLTPTTFYRRVPAARGPRDLSDDLGMFVNSKRSVHEVTRDDLVAEGSSWGLITRDAQSVVVGALEAARVHVHDAANFVGAPGAILAFVEGRIDALLDGRGANYKERASSLDLGDISSSPPST
jgi:serine/threonine-protein kinase HipA